MKIEKINENKVKITLTFEELENRKISLQDIESDAAKAKDLFIDLLEESNLEEDFVIDESHLFVEASSDNNNLFTVIITKIEDIPELKQYSLLEKKPSMKRYGKSNKLSNANYKYTVDSNIYEFSSLEDVLALCEVAKSERIFFGKNSLYKQNSKYYLIFSKFSIKNPKFLKTYVFLSEYCKNYYVYDLYETSIKERSQLIIENNALQTLSKL